MIFPTEYIYVLNIVIVALIVLFAFSGYRQGFLLKLLGILGFVVCAILAWLLSAPFSKLLHLFPSDLTPMANTIAGPLFYDAINRVIVFVILFFLLGIVVVLLKPILKAVGKLPVIAEVNTILGTLIGAIQGFVVVMIISFVFSTPLFANGIRVIDESFLKPINAFSETACFFMNDYMEELKSIQKIVTPSTVLNEEDLAHIREWLLRYDLETTAVDAFMRDLAGE